MPRPPGNAHPRAATTRTPGGDVDTSKVGHDLPTVELPATFTLDDIARTLRCSKRHVAGMRSGGRLPQPIPGLRPLLRWDRRTLERWLAFGSPNLEKFEELERAREDPR